MQANYNLLDEIDRINQRLIETVVDMESSEVDLESDILKGKVVKCSYIPMAVRKAYKSYISSAVVSLLNLLAHIIYLLLRIYSDILNIYSLVYF